MVRRWLLKAYKDHDFGAAQAMPVDLVNPQSLTKVPAPFSLAFKGQAPATDVNTALYQFQRPDDLTVNFEFSDGRIDVKKSFRFLEDSYLVAVNSQATQNGAPLPHALSWRGGFGDSTANNALTNQHALYYDLGNSKLNVKQVKDAKDGPVSFAGQYSFAGLEDALLRGRVPAGGTLSGGVDRILRSPFPTRTESPIPASARRWAARLPTASPFSRARRTTSSWAKSIPSWSN